MGFKIHLFLIFICILCFNEKTYGQTPTSKPDSTVLIFLKKSYGTYKLKNRIPYIKRDDYIESNRNVIPSKTNSSFDLNESGSLSTSLFGGNNQSVSLQSNLNLTLNGKLAKDTYVKAHLSDNNLSQQTVGYSQTLQEFEKLFFEISHKKHKVRAGDIEYKTNRSPFLQAEKQSRGFRYQYKSDSTYFQAGLANSRGQYTRYQLQVSEGNRGPYLLKGTNGEEYIYVLPQSEQVFLDGKQLTYGLKNDYVLNYNTGEITFNQKIPISAASRIQIEFEYSQENYTRNIMFSDLGFTKSTWDFDFSYLSNSDNKKSPKDINLSPDDIIALSESGDSIVYGIAAVETTFDPKKNLYVKQDSLGEEIWVYTVDSTKTLYQVQFTFVGEGSGDYIINSGISAQGNVFEWKPMINNIRQGNYAPLRRLTPPKSLSNTTLGVKKRWKNNQYSKIDIALSNEDENLFSTKDDNNNTGFAARLENQLSISKRYSIRLLNKQQLVERNYKSPNPIRNQENLRLWNLNLNDSLHVNEYYLSNILDFSPSDSLSLQIGLDVLDRDSLFSGNKTILNFKYKSINTNNSFLKAESKMGKSTYFRSLSTYNASTSIGDHLVHLEIEDNEIKNKFNKLDSLSYAFYRLNYTLKTKDFKGGPLSLNSEFRTDRTIEKNRWINEKQWYFIQSEKLWDINPNITFNQFLYYKEIVSDSSALRSKQLSTLFDVKSKFLNKALKSHLHYSLNQGQEAELNIQYLEVPIGQGTHIWNDYNSNNIKEFNEFEIAVFQNEADYIKLASPGRNFIKTFENRFSFNHTLRLGKLIKSKKTFKRLRIKTQFNISQKIKNTNLSESISPFKTHVNEHIISKNKSSYYQLYWPFYKSNQIRYYFENNTTSRLISYGLEDLDIKKHTALLKIHPSERNKLTFEWSFTNKDRYTATFVNRNYTIHDYSYKIEHQLNINNKSKWTNQFIYSNKINTAGIEKLSLYNGSSNIELRMKENQFFNLRFSLIKNTFTGNQDSSIGYEMLEGLKTGNNILWNLGWQKNLNKTMKLILSYQGRKSNGFNTIHTGQIQIRADL